MSPRKPVELRPQFIEVTPDLQQFGRVHQPIDAEAPIFTKPIRAAVHRWLVEMQAEEELRAVDLEPRRAALLGGLPGTGKTTLAHHIAARLGLALVEISMPALTSMYLGETGKNVRKLFADAVSQHQKMILFLDEIDAIAAARIHTSTSAAHEKNAIVIAMMSEIDHYPGTIIAATNRPDQIDSAMWRRFGLHLDIPAPDSDTRYAILCKYLEPFELDADAMGLLSDLTTGATPALLRQMMEGIKRDLVLQPRFGGENTPVAVIERVISALAPHADAACPPLWADMPGSLRRLKSLPWPPIRKDDPRETAK